MDSTALTLIDADVHVRPAGIADLVPYLDEHWRDYVDDTGFAGPADTAYPAGAPTSVAPWAQAGEGVDDTAERLAEALLDPLGIDRAVVSCQLDVASLHDPYLADALARAANDWLLEQWLARDKRLRASLVVATQDAALAAREIQRLGDQPGVVAVTLPARGAIPYGHAFHTPLLAAAADAGLVVGLHFGGAQGNPPTSVGWPSYYVEEHAGMASAFQGQLLSLVLSGAFERLPTLRVALVESGWSWLPALAWRADKDWKGLRREVPWVVRPPSEYIREHVRVTLQPNDAPPEAKLLERLVAEFGLDELLMFSTDYPHWHVDVREDALTLPPCLGDDPARRERILVTNARDLYGGE